MLIFKSYQLVGGSENWQQQDAEEKQEEEKKTETIRLTDTESNGVEINNEKEVKHIHTHRKVVLSAYPPSLVPRLHCVLSHKLQHNNPLLGRPWSQKSIPKTKLYTNKTSFFLIFVGTV